MRNSWFYLFLLTALLGCGKQEEAASNVESQPNVLFIAIDDLRPELGCYGAPALTPNIDRLAETGVLFDRHYVQFAVCIPSRVSLLTGLRPERTHQMYGPPVWEEVEGAQSWGNTFREAGYTTLSLGKIWHLAGDATNADTFDITWRPSTRYTYADPQHQEDWLTFRRLRGQPNPVPIADIERLCPITEAADVPDTAYVDGKVAQRAIQELRRLSDGGSPFMMAVGFVKPHIPFCAPKKYWDLYDKEQIELAEHINFPEGMPPIAFSNHPNFFNYTYGDYPPLKQNQPMPPTTARHLRHAYRAATSYVDAQVGLLLDELDQLDLAENTIVVLWGDHGFHLGDVGHWGKQTNFESATRSPLMMRVPGVAAGQVPPSTLVETVDIFPTLLELCDISPAQITDGKSLVPLLNNPQQSNDTVAFHVFNRGVNIEGKRQTLIGHAVRTNRYRLVSWRIGWGLSDDEYAAELYDYGQESLETINVIDDPNYVSVREELEKVLAEGPAGQFK